ncbi:MAG: hypothetical protein AB1500_07260 [Bacillota bacterium]
MLIGTSNITLSASHTYLEQYTREESLKVWQNNRQAAGTPAPPPAVEGFPNQEEPVALMLEDDNGFSPGQTKLEKVKDDPVNADSKLMIVKLLIEKLTGRKIRIFKAEDLKPDCDKNPEGEKADGQQPAQGRGQQGVGWGIAYDSYESYYQYESMSFEAQGTIRTKDGKEINFTLDLNMSREFFSEERFSFRAGDAVKDPLVINFDGQAADLTDMKFSFDVDVDGAEDQISFVRPGTGFLALDKNDDGTINDGGELFGPTTGKGFEELKTYDVDGNNWIDEADPIFEKLLIWSKDQDGNDSLSSLKEKGIGAIYLGNVSSAFSLTDQANELQGQVQSSGIYLKEDGGAGVIQQVDLVI